jgi:hypothetical protein
MTSLPLEITATTLRCSGRRPSEADHRWFISLLSAFQTSDLQHITNKSSQQNSTATPTHALLARIASSHTPMTRLSV